MEQKFIRQIFWQIKLEFLGGKSDGQAKPKQQNESYFDDDVFTPVDDG